MKLSIITPSFNSGKTIERAIKSVLTQDYTNYEHIIVDSGSNDKTLDILKRYPHLKWISEPDRSQVHAMNKGFSMATGEIIGYLNADDQYADGAFSSVIPHFKIGAKMVVGKVLVRSELDCGINEWICDPKTDFHSILRHWESNAFCVNPVGYFYLREVQEKVPLREETGAKHDLEFLMESSLHFPVTKIDKVLGTFNQSLVTQTAREQLNPSYWQPENFSFVERLVGTLPEKDQQLFRLHRESGYQLRRQWIAKDASVRGVAKELFEKGEIFMLPEDDNGCAASHCGFVKSNRIGTKRDWIIPVIKMGKVTSMSIYHTLKQLHRSLLSAEVYHVHQRNPSALCYNHIKSLPYKSFLSVSLSLKQLFAKYKDLLVWKFIAGVRDPISAALSDVFEYRPDITTSHDIMKIIKILLTSQFTYFYRPYLKIAGINIHNYHFDKNKKFSMITENNINILLYRVEDVSTIFANAIEEYLGIPNLKLSKIIFGADKNHARQCNEAQKELKFDENFLQNIYRSEYVSHFYSENEICRMIDKWRINNKGENEGTCAGS
jgi:glycosyltransferase involved in cell wall biosynthesis